MDERYDTKLSKATRVQTRTASASETPCGAARCTASPAAIWDMPGSLPAVTYFARQCFMQISYSVVQAARE